MSDKIEYNDLFADDAFKKGVEGVESIISAFKRLETELKVVAVNQKEALTGFNVNKSDDIKKLNDELAKTNKILTDLQNANKAVETGEKELAKIRLEEIKLMRAREKSIDDFTRKEEAATAKKLKLAENERLSEIQLQKAREKAFDQFEKQNRSYTLLTKKLNDLRDAYKDAAVSEGEMSKQAQNLLKQIAPLDAQLKRIDANVGQYQRNVGNYKSALEGASGAVTNVLGAAGISVGLSAGISFLKDSVGEFAKLESSLKNLQAITGVSNKDLEFFSKNAEELGINVKGGAVAVVEAYKLIGSAKPELLENKEALNEVTKATILLSQASGLELPDAATQLTNALNSFNAPAEEAGKYVNVLSAASKLGAKEIPFVAEALSKFGGVAKSAGVSIETSAAAIEILGAKIPQAESVGTNLRGIFIKLQTEAAKSGREFKGLGGELDLLAPRVNDITYLSKTFGEQNLLAIQTLIQERDALDKFTEGITDTNAALEQASINTDTYANKQLRLENTFNSLKASVGEFLVGAGSQLLDFYDVLSGKVSFTDAAIKFNAASRNKGAERIIELSNEEQKAFIEKNAAMQKANKQLFDNNQITLAYYELNRKNLAAELKAYVTLLDAKIKSRKATTGSKEVIDEETASINKNTSAKINNSKSTGTFEEAQKKAQEELDEQQRLLDFEYNKDKKERDQKQRDEDFKAAQDEADRLLALDEETRKKEDEIRKKADEEKKKQREEDLKNLFDVASKALQIAEKEINEKEKLRQEALDKEIKDREENIDIQRKRAEQGLSNTLAFEEKALKDAEARKEEENKKALKREKALTFFKLLSANAEKEPNSALQKTITEMLLGEAIAGAFFKGTEKVEDDLKGNKVHNGRDGYVVAVDGSERVLTGEQNKLIGNMSNEDLAKLAHDYNNNKLLPNYMLNEGVNTSVSENIYASMQLSQMVKMNERLESVEEAIKNKPVSNTSFDNLGHIIREEIRNGLKTITKTPLTKGYGN
jgi:TP901 family phage tail tape measure protein